MIEAIPETARDRNQTRTMGPKAPDILSVPFFGQEKSYGDKRGYYQYSAWSAHAGDQQHALHRKY
jgi:hypothetical protein